MLLLGHELLEAGDAAAAERLLTQVAGVCACALVVGTDVLPPQTGQCKSLSLHWLWSCRRQRAAGGSMLASPLHCCQPSCAGFYRRERWEGPLASALLLLRECHQHTHDLGVSGLVIVCGSAACTSTAQACTAMGEAATSVAEACTAVGEAAILIIEAATCVGSLAHAAAHILCFIHLLTVVLLAALPATGACRAVP